MISTLSDFETFCSKIEEISNGSMGWRTRCQNYLEVIDLAYQNNYNLTLLFDRLTYEGDPECLMVVFIELRNRNFDFNTIDNSWLLGINNDRYIEIILQTIVPARAETKSNWKLQLLLKNKDNIGMIDFVSNYKANFDEHSWEAAWNLLIVNFFNVNNFPSDIEIIRNLKYFQ